MLIRLLDHTAVQGFLVSGYGVHFGVFYRRHNHCHPTGSQAGGQRKSGIWSHGDWQMEQHQLFATGKTSLMTTQKQSTVGAGSLGVTGGQRADAQACQPPLVAPVI